MKNILLKSKIGENFLIENSVLNNNIYKLKKNNNPYSFLFDNYKIKNKRIINKFNVLVHSKSWVYNSNKNNNYFKNENFFKTKIDKFSISTSTLKIKNLKKKNIYEDIFKNKYLMNKKNKLVLNKYSNDSILKINETFKKVDFLKNSLNYLFPKIYNIRLKEKNNFFSRNNNFYNNHNSYI